MDKAQVIEKVKQTVDKLNNILKMNVDYPEVVFEDLGSQCAGRANIYFHKVMFHPGYMHHEHFEKETIVHEVVHLFVPKAFPSFKQHHGPEFRRLMNIMGCEGKTYHNMGTVETTTPKRKVSQYEYVCACTTHTLSAILHGKIRRGQTRICNRCRTPLKAK